MLLYVSSYYSRPLPLPLSLSGGWKAVTCWLEGGALFYSPSVEGRDTHTHTHVVSAVSRLHLFLLVCVFFFFFFVFGFWVCHSYFICGCLWFERLVFFFCCVVCSFLLS